MRCRTAVGLGWVVLLALSSCLLAAEPGYKLLVVTDPRKQAGELVFLMGLLNSRLMRFYYETSFPTLHVQRNELASLPIRTINFSDPTDVQRHERMVALVERMLGLQRELAAAQTPSEKTRLQRQVEATDSQIDTLGMRGIRGCRTRS